MLHTLHAGAIRYAVCWTLSVVKVSNATKLGKHLIPLYVQKSHTRGAYKVVLHNLDECLKNFSCGMSTDGEFQFTIPSRVRSLSAHFEAKSQVSNNSVAYLILFPK